MRQTITATRASTAEPSRAVPSFRRAMAELWHSLSKDLGGTYHPERHYMRGPGPKWHAKHERQTVGRAELGLGGNFSAA